MILGKGHLHDSAGSEAMEFVFETVLPRSPAKLKVAVFTSFYDLRLMIWDLLSIVIDVDYTFPFYIATKALDA
jgi:hypothetical protein